MDNIKFKIGNKRTFRYWDNLNDLTTPELRRYVGKLNYDKFDYTTVSLKNKTLMKELFIF